MYTFRTRFKKEIVSEFALPAKRSNKVIILCSGMPSYPAKRELFFYFSKKNYWVFLPRYRGTWESSGSFLKKSPHIDIIDVIDELSKGFEDLWSRKIYRIKKPIIYIIGSSFGGTAAILASKDKRVEKSVALSPVIDWRVDSKLEPLNRLEEFTTSAFGNGYRFKRKDWNKLKSGRFYNPISEVNNLDPKKLFIIHSQDDEVVYPGPVKEFTKILGCKFWLLKQGGHLSSSKIMDPIFSRRILRFLKK